jgi:hypothetical protein
MHRSRLPPTPVGVPVVVSADQVDIPTAFAETTLYVYLTKYRSNNELMIKRSGLGRY